MLESHPHYSANRALPSLQPPPRPKNHHRFPQRTSRLWPHDELLSSLLSSVSTQHAPIAPSPLNPTLCESDLILGRHIYQLRKTAQPQVTRRPPEISPTLRFLKRKAYVEYQTHYAEVVAQRHHHSKPAAGRGDTGVGVFEEAVCCERWRRSAVGGAADDNGEYVPAAFIVESGSLLHVVQVGCARRHGATADIEKQIVAHRPPPRWQSPWQRWQFFFILCVMSACLTLLTGVSLSVLKADRYYPI